MKTIRYLGVNVLLHCHFYSVPQKLKTGTGTWVIATRYLVPKVGSAANHCRKCEFQKSIRLISAIKLKVILKLAFAV